jgi:hypothetical protein
MVTLAIMKLIEAIVHAILFIIPPIPVPSWLTSSSSAFATVFADADSMSVWFPTALALTVLAAYLAIRTTGFLIKIGRIVASFMTGGGGSAA